MVALVIELFFNFRFCKIKVLDFIIEIKTCVIELIACACLCVKAFELASGMVFFGEAIALVNSRFVFKVMLADWSVDRNFRSVINS